jgi:putative (di)nucleoside polyphosphate hydrolase
MESAPPLSSGPTPALPYRPCVGVVLLNREGLVWIGRRLPKWSEDKSAFIWQMPQGGIDKDEEPRRAALRELEEETGVQSVEIIAECADWLSYDLPENLMGVALKGKYRGQVQKWFVMRFLGDDAEIRIEARNGHKQEFDSWRWAPLAELPGLIVPFKRAIYEALVVQFGDLARPEPAGQRP